MKVLVAHASAHGSTREIAERIAQRLEERGLQVETHPAADVSSLDSFDAAVIGSAVHGQKWLPPAADLVAAHAEELARRPVWLFSVCSVGATSSVFGPRVSRRMRSAQTETKDVAAMRALVHPRDHRRFAGVVRRGDWGQMGNLFVVLLRGRYGDHRDWADIEAWADGIADSLTSHS